PLPPFPPLPSPPGRPPVAAPAVGPLSVPRSPVLQPTRAALNKTPTPNVRPKLRSVPSFLPHGLECNGQSSGRVTQLLFISSVRCKPLTCMVRARFERGGRTIPKELRRRLGAGVSPSVARPFQALGAGVSAGRRSGESAPRTGAGRCPSAAA